MVSRLLLSIVATICYVSADSNDTLSEYEASLAVMDIIWLIYAIFAILITLCFVTKCGIWNEYCLSDNYDALSQECYADIITARGYDATMHGVGDKRELSLMVLRRDLKEKRIWHNDYKKDLAIFVRNEHALFSLCYSHPDHPFSRRDRRCILISVILMDFGIAMWITYMFFFINLDNTSSFIIDYLLSYLFGFMMTIIQTILVKFAVCAAAES